MPSVPPSHFEASLACRVEKEVQEVVLYSIVKKHERGFGSAFVFRTKIPLVQ
jgi:hypothetical protein